jgi:hypothetical protein
MRQLRKAIALFLSSSCLKALQFPKCFKQFLCYFIFPYSVNNYYFFRKVGIFSPASDEAINMPSLFNRVSSFLALITHQIESLL